MSENDLQRYLQLKAQLRRLSDDCAVLLAANNRGPDWKHAAARRDAVVAEMLSMRDADGWAQAIPGEVPA
jgi:hypothetical protein